IPSPRNDFDELRLALSYDDLKMNGTLTRAQISFRRPTTSICNCSDSTTHGPAMRNRGRCNPTSKPQRFMRSGDELRARSYRIAGRDSPALECRVDECDKQRMAAAWIRSEFGMELAAEEPGMARKLDRPVAILPLGDQRHYRVRRCGIELGAVRIGEASLVPRIFDDRQLHSQANAEIGNAVLARMANRLDLALDAALAESARHQDRVHALEAVDTVAFHGFRIEVMNGALAAGVNAGVGQRVAQRYVRFGQVDVFADHGDVDVVLRMDQRFDQVAPGREIGGTRTQGK